MAYAQTGQNVAANACVHCNKVWTKASHGTPVRKYALLAYEKPLTPRAPVRQRAAMLRLLPRAEKAPCACIVEVLGRLN